MVLTPTNEQQFHRDFSKNVASMEATRRKVNSQINDSLRRDDEFSLKIYTNLYLLVYSAWTEASLIKLVHTPFGFTIEEKKKILKDKDIINKWKKCVNTAFSKFRNNGSEIPNKKKKIHKLIDDYLKTQAQIRNKIAHGQWEFPLHKNNITHDNEAQTLMNLIDVMQIDIWFEVFKEIIEIVRGLIDARPKNNHIAHYNYYFTRLTNIQAIIDERKTWTLADKKKRLKLKPRRIGN
ncbi:hypothetical protein [Solitalea lacus]|uniref:hypothetical protein n=1 Tax=Solitalea lacus TaxID=2911172 RepID=UPI001ED9CABF|nr:hypothetical protein [Solitalea lacus]UKJ09189.1 hypothetical protein L2B55_08535 [Solitalea lacus]